MSYELKRTQKNRLELEAIIIINSFCIMNYVYFCHSDLCSKCIHNFWASLYVFCNRGTYKNMVTCEKVLCSAHSKNTPFFNGNTVSGRANRIYYENVFVIISSS